MSASQVPAYRVGVIGDSTHPRSYGHGIHVAWVGLPQAEIVALSDPDAGAHAQRAAECGARRTYTDHAAMLEAEDLDFVSICPHYYARHAEWLHDCIAAGVKGIYVEKPMTRTLGEADEVIAAAEAGGVRIAVAHQWGRYLPCMDALRALVSEGGIGDLRVMRGHGKCDARGGAHDTFVLGTHVFDLMRSIAGDVAWVSGQVRQNGRALSAADIEEGPEGIGLLAGDELFSAFGFHSGVTATFHSFADSEAATQTVGLEVWGTRGGASIRNGGAEVAVYPLPAVRPFASGVRWESIEAPVYDRQGLELSGDAIGHRTNQRAVEDLMAACAEGRDPVSSARSATAALEMAMAIFESERGQGRVELPLATRENPFEVWKSRGRA
ncbi:MAG: Gfo/Idh/MocA family oxidoreductase [Chloroflexota bacterium]|nr:Gfo/Idh/MocA family oxidoreductase [Chloroflexota bacterium]MDE2898929.1 Gfo/Idh/MocA family oxidoreductase [Chloroflexota bacterium]